MLVFKLSWVAEFLEQSVCDFGGSTLDFPENLLISPLNFTWLYSLNPKLFRYGHIQHQLENPNPCLQRVFLHQFWRHLELEITIEEQFQDGMQNLK